ncbi:MAG: Fe(3+) ABC transporter substrate-binding protein [Pseudomonadota bacterium]
MITKNPIATNRRDITLLTILSFFLATFLAGLPAAAESNGAVNIYSSRHYDTDLALYDEFTEETGIKVNLLEAGADALIERIKNEGEYSPADILITVDAGRLWRAEEAGILASVTSETLQERLPNNLRHPDGLWFGISKRARVIIYNKAAGKPEALNSYADLTKPEFEGKICVRSSSNIYNISLLASIVANEGTEAAEAWADGVVTNLGRRPQGNDTTQIRAVASGECGISIVNSYYLARFAASNNPQTKAVFDGVGVIFPDQEGRGTHVNISGAGVLQNAPNKENAVRFIEYLTTQSAQEYFANGNNEYPAALGVETSSAVDLLGQFKEDQVNVAALGANQAEAIRIFNRVGWP